MSDTSRKTIFEDYFKNLDQRASKTVYFYRFIGYDDEDSTMKFLKKYETAARNTGAVVTAPLQNPAGDRVTAFYDIVGNSTVFTKERINKDIGRWIGGNSQFAVQSLTDAMYAKLEELKSQGMNDNILKNAYIKFLCWCKYDFQKVLQNLGKNTPPKVLYEGDISKYEVFILDILYQAGCDVLYLNFTSEASYQTIDTNLKYSKGVYGVNKRIPTINYHTINLEALEHTQKMEENIAGMEGVVVTNSWNSSSFFEVLHKINSVRGEFDNKHIYNLFVRYVGIDEKETYLNRLFKLKEELAKNKKPWIIFDESIPNPTIDEVAQIKKINYANKKELIFALAALIKVSKDTVRNLLVQQAFFHILTSDSESNLSKLYNYGVHMICWMNRYIEQLYYNYDSEHYPVVIYYGRCKIKEADFLCMLSYMGIDVISITSDIEDDLIFASLEHARLSRVELLPESMTKTAYPDQEIKVRVATAAYEAERELDTMLYSGTGLFRNRQFTRSVAVTLKTTYDEIGILWKEEAKYRPSFDASEGRVVVPNIFAKVCGVKDENVSEYYSVIQSMITDKTILWTQIPNLPDNRPCNIKAFTSQLIRNGQILPDVIKRHREYQYAYFNEDTQDYILEKIQELLNLKWIETYDNQFESIVLSTLLNLDKNTLQLIQNFDFTKDIPKLIIVDTNESLMSLEDSIYVTYLNLIGFDIVVFTPTGYRNLEQFIKRGTYEEYTIGGFKFDLTLPDFARYKGIENAGKGLLGKLFGKGRN